MKAREISTTLALGLGLTVALLWLLGSWAAKTTQAQVPGGQGAGDVALEEGCGGGIPCFNSVQDAVKIAPGSNRWFLPLVLNQRHDPANLIPENSILITDTTRQGWENAIPYTGDPSGDGGSAGNIDWITITMAHDHNELYVRYEVDDGPPFNSEQAYNYSVFVNVDGKRGTGFIGDFGQLSIGADVLFQGRYEAGEARASVFKFTGASQTTWKWSWISDNPFDEGVPSGTTRDIEWKTLISDLDVFGDGVTGFEWVATQAGGSNDYDFYPDGGNDSTAGSFNTYSLVVPNPECGFYHHTQTHTPSQGETAAAYRLLARHPGISTLQRYRDDEGITLIHRNFWLSEFVTSTISAEYLANMQADFDTIRAAGAKMIVRCAYTAAYTDPITCAHGSDLYDASREWILTHTRQLSDVLRANSDVIAAVQAGFVGGWGEWFGSCHFPDLECGCSPGDPAWDDRRDVLFAVLDMLPVTRMVQLRTPRYKYNIFSDTVICSDCMPQVLTPVNESQAHTGIPVARTGHHNDCFVSSASDYGTYIDPPTEYPYLQEDTKYVVMGGETCIPDFSDSTDRRECHTATKELEQFHWSFLNIDWYTPTLQLWRDGGCFPEIEQRLGYRLALLHGTYDSRVMAGGDFHFNLQLVNEGYAAPFNPRVVELVLRHTSGLVHIFDLPDDPRFWLPGETHAVSHRIGIPLSLPAGSYELLLNLPDPEPRLRHRPEYAIRLAGSVWEASTGYNKLNHTVTVVCDGIYLPIILEDD
jgi:hypothetical protein